MHKKYTSSITQKSEAADQGEGHEKVLAFCWVFFYLSKTKASLPSIKPYFISSFLK